MHFGGGGHELELVRNVSTLELVFFLFFLKVILKKKSGEQTFMGYVGSKNGCFHKRIIGSAVLLWQVQSAPLYPESGRAGLVSLSHCVLLRAWSTWRYERLDDWEAVRPVDRSWTWTGP